MLVYVLHQLTYLCFRVNIDTVMIKVEFQHCPRRPPEATRHPPDAQRVLQLPPADAAVIVGVDRFEPLPELLLVSSSGLRRKDHGVSSKRRESDQEKQIKCEWRLSEYIRAWGLRLALSMGSK